MKLYTFNVNGIRSAINKGLLDWIKSESPDILCLQEIKLSETELVEHLFVELGFHCYWFPAEKKGYAGVAILSKFEAESVIKGVGHSLYDLEGRVLTAIFKNFTVISAYFPSGTTGDIRQKVKMEFLDYIYNFFEANNYQNNKVFLCGDVNICHEAIDIHNPKSNANTSGFLPEERAWVGKFIEQGYIDSFRLLNKDPHNYTWWSYRAGARSKNLGWRIDYIFASKNLKETILEAKIHSDVVMSDHCPMSIKIEI
jgi:exodeoxyribonuclease-3